MKPTLLVLAAGMGSRYGGIKQLDRIGPSGEVILDYSVFDAIRAGFGKVVFVIRKDIEKDFREVIIDRLPKDIKTEVVYQELDNIPEGFPVNPERTKPYGTGHAILVAKEKINEPFVVINADDFYGAEAYKSIADYLTSLKPEDKGCYSMVGYHIKNTLSDHGSVSRGVCNINQEGNLDTVTERTKIYRENGTIVYMESEDNYNSLDDEALVSMNLWGFMPSIFDHLDSQFREFLTEQNQNPKSEFYIPFVVDRLIQEGQAKVKVLTSEAKWFGVTYKEDRPMVVEKLNELVEKGIYPDNLWK